MGQISLQDTFMVLEICLFRRQKYLLTEPLSATSFLLRRPIVFSPVWIQWPLWHDTSLFLSPLKIYRAPLGVCQSSAAAYCCANTQHSVTVKPFKDSWFSTWFWRAVDVTKIQREIHFHIFCPCLEASLLQKNALCGFSGIKGHSLKLNVERSSHLIQACSLDHEG